MKNYSENEKTAIQYLLGELADENRDRFEERLFEDEDFSRFLDDVENDLIDEYLRGELGFDEKRKFENAYLKNESRRKKIEVGKVLHENLFKEQEKTVASTVQESSFLQSLKDFFRVPNLALAGGLAAILLMILMGGIWFLNNRPPAPIVAEKNNSNQSALTPNINSKDESADKIESNKVPITNSNKSENEPKPEIDKRKKEVLPKPKNEKPKPVAKPKAVQTPKRVFAFSLLPPLRSSEKPVLKIPETAKTVRLKLFDNFGEKYMRFIVELIDSDGNTISKQEISGDTKRERKSIVVNLAAGKLKNGSYELAVSGVTKEGNVEEINFYNFVVKNQ